MHACLDDIFAVRLYVTFYLDDLGGVMSICPLLSYYLYS